MKHTIRRYGQLEQIDCEIGSDVKDLTGKEIIEGDIIQTADGHKGVVRFREGQFLFGSFPAFVLASEGLTIVGHKENES